MELELRAIWNYHLAILEYQLVRTDELTTPTVLAEGDRRWAARTARHFNLDLPENADD